MQTQTAKQAPVPTSPANKARIEAMFTSPLLMRTLDNLYGRWLDESQYENINDYGKVISAALPAGITLTKMTKRPFGFHFTVGTDAVYALTTTTRSMGWKRIA